MSASGGSVEALSTSATPSGGGLSGRRVLITAPSSYAARLADQVLALGGEPIFMPTIVTEPLQDHEHSELDAALRELDAKANSEKPAFAYIAFTSRNGIEAFLRRASTLGIARNFPSLLRGCTVGALGKDAEMLVQAGIEVGLLPDVSSPSGMVAELEKRGVRGSGAPVLVPVPEVSGVPEPVVVPNFIAGLNELGMKVYRVPAYATKAVVKGNEVEEGLLKEGKVDAVAFSSTAEATALALSLGGADSLRAAVAGTSVACFGPVTAKAVREELGLEVAIVSKDFSSFAGYATAMAEYFGEKQKEEQS